MKVLVTGGAGFIGYHISKQLIALGHQVLVIDDLSGGDQNIIPIITLKHEKSLQFSEIDLCNYDKTEEVIMQFEPEVVFHLAATAREGASHFDPVNMVNRNIVTYTNTLENCVKAGTLKRFVLFSSMSVYGDQPAPFSEDTPKKPVDVYAQCKAFMEDSIKDLSEAHNFEYVIVRPHNVYGEGQSMSDRYRNVAMIWINSLLRGDNVYIYGDGSHTRAFSYIADSLDCFVKCGFQEGLSGEIINIGSSKEYTLNELCMTILSEFFNTKAQLELQPLFEKYVEYLPDRFKEVAHAWCTTEKSEKLLGFKDANTLREGIKKTIRWAKEEGACEWTDYKLPLRNEKCPKNWNF